MMRHKSTLYWSTALIIGLAGCGDSKDSGTSTQAAQTGAPSTSQAQKSAVGGSELESILTEPDYYQRISRLTALLADSGDDAQLLSDVEAVVRRFRVDESVAEFGLLFRYWAEQDPASAVDWALAPGKERYQLAAVYTAYEAWGRLDPEQATLGIQRTAIERDYISRTAQLAMIHGWFERDRDQLLSYLRDQGIGVERQRAIFGYIMSLAAADGSDAAKAWATSLPDDDERFKRGVLRQTMNTLMIIDLPAAVAWCDEICDSNSKATLRRPIMRARLRAGDDPIEVLEWLSKMPKESPEQAEERMLTLQIAYSTWATKDRSGAMDWLEGLVDSDGEPSWLPLLYRYYASLLAREKPLEAVAFVERKIEAGPDRRRALIAVGQMWKTHDPEGMSKWLEDSPLPEEARRQVLDFQRPG